MAEISDDSSQTDSHHFPSEMTDGDYARFEETQAWRAPVSLIAENLVDLMHAPILHGSTYTLSRGRTDDELDIESNPNKLRVRRRLQSGVAFDWIEFIGGPVPFFRLDIPLPRTAGSGPPMRIIGLLTPIDERATLVHFPRFRRVQGLERIVWKSLYRLFLRRRHSAVLAQDRILIEGQARTAPTAREHLRPPDRGVIALRRMLSSPREQADRG